MLTDNKSRLRRGLRY